MKQPIKPGGLLTIRNYSLAIVLSALAGAVAPAGGTTAVMVQNYEKVTVPSSVWVVNIPNENASIQVSTNGPHDGKACLNLQYEFVGTGNFQYLGIRNQVKILAPVRTLHFWIKGDNSQCSYGVRLDDASGETHQYSLNTGQGGIIDFSGWKEAVFDLTAGHETWGGDKNGKLDYPITAITFTIGQPKDKEHQLARKGTLSFDDVSVDSEQGVAETLGCQIAVVSPPYGSDIQGDTTVTLAAPGFKSAVAKCWQSGDGFGSDATIATVALNPNGDGTFVFPANVYPHGPLTVRISAEQGSVKDNCYLQLYNRGGISWNEGLPADPPPAQGMALVFADDFKQPLSISSTDPKAAYYDHKPPYGTQDFSSLPFTGFDRTNNPFTQVDTYLRIRASEPARSAGLISSAKNDARGIKAKMPCYFECRLLGPNAIGTWPAFWLLTDWDPQNKSEQPTDELDIIEAYGGEGVGEPNAYDTYRITPHAWSQGAHGKAMETQAEADVHNPISMKKAGIPSAWYEAFHIYGCKITESDTIYYCDNIEVARHKTLEVSKVRPFYFLINLATGGGWRVDLSRYDGLADMYVDYVRVYQGTNQSSAGIR